MSGKAIAKCFGHKEVEEELLDQGLREKWVFSSEKCTPMSGSFDDAMEFIDKKRSDELYLHNCSAHCKGEGTKCIIFVKMIYCSYSDIIGVFSLYCYSLSNVYLLNTASVLCVL